MSNVEKHKSMVCDGFFGCCGFQFKPRGRAGWKFQFVAQSALAHWWFVGWQVEAVKVGQEQFNKLPFLTASHVKCSRCVSCILKNLMLNLFFCYVNYQLSEFSFGFPPILWSSFRPKYFEDFFFFLVNSPPDIWLSMLCQTHDIKTIYVFIKTTWDISITQFLVLYAKNCFPNPYFTLKTWSLTALLEHMVTFLSFSFLLCLP